MGWQAVALWHWGWACGIFVLFADLRGILGLGRVVGDLTAPVRDPPLCTRHWVTMGGILTLVAGREPPVMALGLGDTGACEGEGSPGYPP